MARNASAYPSLLPAGPTAELTTSISIFFCTTTSRRFALCCFWIYCILCSQGIPQVRLPFSSSPFSVVYQSSPRDYTARRGQKKLKPRLPFYPPSACPSPQPPSPSAHATRPIAPCTTTRWIEFFPPWKCNLSHSTSTENAGYFLEIELLSHNQMLQLLISVVAESVFVGVGIGVEMR